MLAVVVMTSSEGLVLSSPVSASSGMNTDTHRQELVEMDAFQVGVQRNVAERRVYVRADMLDV